MFILIKYYLCFKGLGESTLQWPKNVVTNTIFQNYATFNFHQANIKRGFHKKILRIYCCRDKLQNVNTLLK